MICAAHLVERLLHASVVVMLASTVYHYLKLPVGHRGTAHTDVSDYCHFFFTII